MKLSLCIPCVDKHIPLFEKLITSIQYYTRKPDEIICSISPKFLKLNLSEEKKRLENKYNDLNLTILVRDTKTNCSENLNNCFDHVSGDIILITGADDIIHPQKCEIMEKLFTEYPDTKMILHRFKVCKERIYELKDYKKINIDKNKLYFQFKSNKIPRNYPPVYITNYDYNSIAPEQPFASGYVTIVKNVLDRVKFKNISKGEDSLFIKDVHDTFEKTLFIDECMGKYVPSYTWK